jgi:hypothetical protein
MSSPGVMQAILKRLQVTAKKVIESGNSTVKRVGSLSKTVRGAQKMGRAV